MFRGVVCCCLVLVCVGLIGFLLLCVFVPLRVVLRCVVLLCCVELCCVELC